MRCTVAFGAVLLITLGCGAQENESLRAQAKTEVDAALAANRRALAAFLDKSKSADARLAAVNGVAATIDRGDTAAALELVRDEEQPVTIRVRALELSAQALGRDAEILTEVLALLRNTETPAPLRRAIATTLHLLLVGGGTPTARHEDIFAALREVAKDPDPELRAIALSTLAAEGDSTAQQMLVADLRDANAQLVPPEEAVALLALHPSGDTLPVLREVLAQPPNAEAQVEAARALGADVQSHDELQQFVRDNSASDALRFAALGALNANAPEKIAAAAVPLLNDENASDDARIFAIKAVQAVQEAKPPGVNATPPPQSPEEKAFDAAVRSLRTKAKSTAVRDAAKEYVAKKQ